MSNSKFSETNPSASEAHVKNLLLKHYGLKALHITELIPFDRRNYSVEVVPQSSCVSHENDEDVRNKKSPRSAVNNGHIDEATTDSGATRHQNRTQSLVMKIFKQPCTGEELLKSQQQIFCSRYLRKRGFLCPDVLPSNKGELIVPTYSDRYAMLMTRLPGQMLGACRSLLTPAVLYELGILLAVMHQALQDFDGRSLEPDPSDPWCLENMHLLSHYLHYIKDDGKRKMMAGFISAFQNIREKFHVLQKGVIHGDFHDCNIIVDWPAAADITTESPSSTSPSLVQPVFQTSLPSAKPANLQHSTVLQKYGLIDFEEVTYSYPALELSRLIADMMIGCSGTDLLDIGGHILAGYLTVNNTVVRQFDFGLYHTALVCLIQYIVLGLHEIQLLGETSEYWLEGLNESKDVLQKLENTEASEVYKVWGDVLDLYGLQNPFIQH